MTKKTNITKLLSENKKYKEVITILDTYQGDKNSIIYQLKNKINHNLGLIREVLNTK